MIWNEPSEDGRCKDCSNLAWCPHCEGREEDEWNVLQPGEERCPSCKKRHDEEVEEALQKEVSKPLRPVLRTAYRVNAQLMRSTIDAAQVASVYYGSLLRPLEVEEWRKEKEYTDYMEKHVWQVQ